MNSTLVLSVRIHRLLSCGGPYRLPDLYLASNGVDPRPRRQRLRQVVTIQSPPRSSVLCRASGSDRRPQRSDPLHYQPARRPFSTISCNHSSQAAAARVVVVPVRPPRNVGRRNRPTAVVTTAVVHLCVVHLCVVHLCLLLCNGGSRTVPASPSRRVVRTQPPVQLHPATKRCKNFMVK